MRIIETEVIVVGSGVGGATVARELSKAGVKVLVAEKGTFVEKIGSKRTAVNFYFRNRSGLWDKSKEGVIIYRSTMLGGSTVVSCGNGVRALEKELKEMGIDLSEEFEEIDVEFGIEPLSSKLIGKTTRRIMDAAVELGYNMVPMPKFINQDKCVSCGNCILGCKYEAKWSPISYLNEAKDNGASILTDVNATEVLISNGRAIGVKGIDSEGELEIYGDIVVLAAGGIGTPVILQKSGIKEAGNNLFIDAFNVTYGSVQEVLDFQKEVIMGAVNHEFYEEKGFILSPYIDPPLSFIAGITSSRLTTVLSRRKTLGIMVKIKDSSEGKVDESGDIEKALNSNDLDKLREGTSIAKSILLKCGAMPRSISTTKARGAHPGGTAAIGSVVDKNQQTRIHSLFVSDASVLPEAPGLPPILTIAALSKRLSRRIAKTLRSTKAVEMV